MLAALDETQSTHNSMPPPPTPPETTSTSSLYRARLLDMPPPRALYDTPVPVPARGLFARNAANAFGVMGTPIPSRVYDNSAGPTRLSVETQDYFTGTQQDRVSMGRSQASFFEGLTGEANRPWTQPEDEEEDDNNTVTAIIRRNQPWTRADDKAEEHDNNDEIAYTSLSN